MKTVEKRQGEQKRRRGEKRRRAGDPEPDPAILPGIDSMSTATRTLYGYNWIESSQARLYPGHDKVLVCRCLTDRISHHIQ